MPHDTPQESIATIRERLIEAEDALQLLHGAMLKAFRKHGHLLVDPGEIEPLAGGGTPKLPPPGGGGG